MVSSSQPLANAAGAQILAKGGNCVDAAIAVSAALCITEPASTGIGGDCFALYYNKKDRKVHGLNGSGRAAKNITVADINELYGDVKRIPMTSALSVTVPGAIAGWYDAFTSWGSGKVSFKDILQPAIDLAENGFPVSKISSLLWTALYNKLVEVNGIKPDVSPKTVINNDTARSRAMSSIPFLDAFSGQQVIEGTLTYNTPVARALSLIADNGPSAFYNGPISKAIVDTTTKNSHKLSLDDLKTHESSFVEPISYNFQGYDVWEIPPNGHGLVALVALGVIQTLHEQGRIDLHKLERNSVEYLHLLIEACKIGFYDSDEHVSDIEFAQKSNPKLKSTHELVLYILSKEHLEKKAAAFSPTKAIGPDVITHPVPDPKFKCDTVYLSVSDANGELCLFINSVYENFGSGLVVPEYGFALQNRGCNFNLTPGEPNCLEGGKRPYHTIIPGMITKDGEMFANFGNMGGFAQPVCHVQHVLNLVVYGLTPQELVDLARFVLNADAENLHTDRGRGGNGPVSTPVTVVAIEKGIGENVESGLRSLGHEVLVTDKGATLFGRAQIITKRADGDKFVYGGGSDPRGDGASVAVN